MHGLLGIIAGLLGAALLAGCGGGASQPRAAAPPAPPVARQVHDALVFALHHRRQSAAGGPVRLPYSAVGPCSGPAAGGAGRYRCRTTPSGRHGLRGLTVAVAPDGSWSTPPIPVSATFHGHRATAASGLWGSGLRLPGY